MLFCSLFWQKLSFPGSVLSISSKWVCPTQTLQGSRVFDFAADVSLCGMKSENDFLRRARCLLLLLLPVGCVLSQVLTFLSENLNAPKPHQTTQVKRNEWKAKFISMFISSPSYLFISWACLGVYEPTHTSDTSGRFLDMFTLTWRKISIEHFSLVACKYMLIICVTGWNTDAISEWKLETHTAIQENNWSGN